MRSHKTVAEDAKANILIFYGIKLKDSQWRLIHRSIVSGRYQKYHNFNERNCSVFKVNFEINGVEGNIPIAFNFRRNCISNVLNDKDSVHSKLKTGKVQKS